MRSASSMKNEQRKRRKGEKEKRREGRRGGCRSRGSGLTRRLLLWPTEKEQLLRPSDPVFFPSRVLVEYRLFSSARLTTATTPVAGPNAPESSLFTRISPPFVLCFFRPFASSVARLFFSEKNDTPSVLVPGDDKSQGFRFVELELRRSIRFGLRSLIIGD